jgi:UDP-hydrolysing UDP-N-acetyl-D-glucosamine 2-epimerase
MRRLAIVSTSRADHSGYIPLVGEIRRRGELDVVVVMSSSSKEDAVDRSDDWAAAEAEVLPPIIIGGDGPSSSAAAAMGAAASGFAERLGKLQPDLAIVLGDRYEMHAAAAAAVVLSVPLAHLHGGESTYGALDDALRHSMTKLSHLHFAATEEYGRRILQMGEEGWRVTVSGAPALDNLHAMSLPSADEVAKSLGIPAGEPPILVTFHPTTLELDEAEDQLEQLLHALDERPEPLVFTAPNADPKGAAYELRIRRYVQERAGATFHATLGTRTYFGLMSYATMMVGNSSSGIIEAPSLGLPVVNVGTRQEGRVRGGNVIDVGNDKTQIAEGMRAASSPGFRSRLEGILNPYGDGRAAPVIVDRLQTVEIDGRLLKKRFEDRVVRDG